MEKAGCPFWVRLILAANCKNQGVAGGYSSKNGVLQIPLFVYLPLKLRFFIF